MRTADLQAGNCIDNPNRLIAGQSILVPHPVPTNTPRPPTLTPTSEGPIGPNLRADNNPIGYRECTTIRWDVDNIDSVYFEGQPVIGHDSRQVCPDKTTTYTLLLILLNGSQQSYTITINVQAICGNQICEPGEILQHLSLGLFGLSSVSLRKGRTLRPFRLSTSLFLWYPNGANFSSGSRSMLLRRVAILLLFVTAAYSAAACSALNPPTPTPTADLHHHAVADQHGDLHAGSADRHADLDAIAHRYADDHAVAAAESHAVEYAGTFVLLRHRQFAVARHPLRHDRAAGGRR